MTKQVRVKWTRIEPILHVNESENASEEESETSYSLSVLSPCPRFYHACAIVQSKDNTEHLRMLVFGGYGQTILNDTYAYRFDSNQWTKNLTQSENAPTARYGHTLVAMDSKASILFGGKVNDDEYLNDMWRFDITDKKWTKIEQTNPIKSRAHHTSIVHNNTMYVFGGSDEESIFDELWAFDIDSCTWTNQTQTENWPSPRDNHTSILFNDCIIMFGGMDNEGSMDELWSYNLVTKEWTKRNKGPTKRAGHSAVVHGGAMFIYAGVNQSETDAKYLNDMWAYHLTNNKWHTVAWKKKQVQENVDDEELFIDDLEPTARANHSAVVVPHTGIMYAFGGFAATNVGQTLYDDFDTCQLPNVEELFQ
jgi:N-acetylneuraminic acid mutarotase